MLPFSVYLILWFTCVYWLNACLQEPSQTLPDGMATADTSAPKEVSSAALGSSSTEAPMSDEQKARIEANRLKALERAAARSRSSQAAWRFPHFTFVGPYYFPISSLNINYSIILYHLIWWLLYTSVKIVIYL